MRKLTSKDIIKTSGEFVVKALDGKKYKFNVVALFDEDQGRFFWCIAKPTIKYPKNIDADSAVLLKVNEFKGKELVEIVYDDKIVDDVFNSYNEYVELISKQLKKKK